MQDQRKGQSTGSTGSRTGTKSGMENRSDLPNTETGDWTGAPPEAVTHQPGQSRSEEAGMRQTSAMIREEQNRSGGQYQGQQGGMQQRGSMGQQGGMQRGGMQQGQMRSDLPNTQTGNWTGAPPEAVTHQPGAQQSEDAGMEQMSMMLREAHEEGDPEFQRREEDLHARQQNLGERERSLQERESQLRTREQDLRQRQSRVMGTGMGATDYTDETHIQNRR